MKARYLATFERENAPLDYFVSEVPEWTEVTKAWVAIEPAAIMAQRSEFEETTQTTSTRKSIIKTTWTPAVAAIDTACRMRATVNEVERTWAIEQVVNVNEANRELHLLVTERT